MKTTRRQRGFSLLELMVTLAILTTVMGVLTDGIIQVQKRSASDIAKIGVAQETRQFMDQILRDLRQCGFPGVGMFDPATGATTSSTYVANGLVAFSSTAIQFEGDVDGSGVSEVYIQVVAGSGGNCPCTVQRGTVLKSVGGTPSYYTELDNVMSQSVFTAYKFDGSAYNSSTDSLSNIKNIGVTLYVQSSQPDANYSSIVYPTTTMVSEARINN